MSVVYRPGYWTDICVLPDGRFAQVTTEGSAGSVFVEGKLFTRSFAPEPLMFCRCACAAHDGRVYSIHQGHDSGSAFLISESGIQNLGPTFGVQPVAIDAQYAYVVRSNQSYDRIRLDNGAVEHLPHGVPGSSQGISDVVDGAIWWADLKRTVSTAAGVTLTYPNIRGSLAVGQADPPQIAGVVKSGPAFTAIPGVAFEPHLAESNGRYAIVARTPQGAAYVEVPPYPALMTGAPPPAPAPVPKPKPEPKPAMRLPDTVQQIVDQLYLRNKDLARGTDDQRRELTKKIAETTRARVGASWGWKAADAGRPPSKDAIAFQDGATLWGFDLFNGSTRIPNDHPAGEVITGQHFIDVAAVDHLADASQPPAPPSVESGADLAALRNEVAALSVKLALLEGRVTGGIIDSDRRLVAIDARVDALEHKPAPKYKATGKTSRAFGHTHDLNVTLEEV